MKLVANATMEVFTVAFESAIDTNSYRNVLVNQRYIGTIALEPALVRAFACGLVCLLAGAMDARAVENTKVENPLYTRWAKFKPGTVVRIETQTENAAKTIEQTTTYRLMEVSDSQLVVDMTIEIRNGGTKDTGSQSFTHKRWFELPKGMTKESLTKPRNVLEEGKETITVAGREFETTWYKTKAKVEAGDTFIKAWYSDAAPGGLVREENETPNAKSKTKREIAEIIEPK